MSHVGHRKGLNISPLRTLLSAPFFFFLSFFCDWQKVAAVFLCVCVCAHAYRSHEFTFYTKQNMSVLVQNTGLSLFVISLTLFYFFTFFCFWLTYFHLNKEIIIEIIKK